MKSGDAYLDDSVQHRCLAGELVSLEEKATVLSQLDIPWPRQPALDGRLRADGGAGGWLPGTRLVYVADGKATFAH